MKELAVGYLKSKALSDRDKALMSLKLLTENAVGIGDHSTGDFYKNLDEALDLLIDAEDRIETLGKHFGT
jgi:hypothetical protein|tara:strand:- start:2426 stop:2635 length:210 start_codon:yes stop_codon:yes gene_type:complete